MTSISVRCAAKYILDADSDYDLKVSANQYTADLDFHPDGLTLILCHATGFCKEIWEPFLRYFLQLVSRDEKVAIKDIYSIESPNHGESAVLNDDVLIKNYHHRFKACYYSEAIRRFLTAGSDKGAKVDFTKRRLVGIGHSIGAASLVMLPNLAPELPFERFIFAEGAISQPDVPGRFQMSSLLTHLAWTRRDVWTSMKSAVKDLKANPVYGQWDDETFDTFCKHTLRPHPASKYEKPYNFNGVTTCLTKEQEAALVRDEDLVYRGLKEYAELTRKLPVHIIYGDEPDLSPRELQETQMDKSLGCYPASVSYVEGAGHLVLQQKPKGTAEAIYAVLLKHAESEKARPKALL